MRTKYAFRPQLEGLEARWVPATIKLIAGSVFISNQAGELTVETTTVAGQLKINDKVTVDKIVTVSGVGSLVSITGTNLANKIHFLADVLAGNKVFPGNLLVNSGNGADTIDVNGQVNGSATLLTGFGNDTVTSLTADVRVGGSLTVVNSLGLDTVDMNSLNYKIGGNLTLSGVGTFVMGGGNKLEVGGSATLVATQNVANKLTATFDGLETKVGRTLQITGGVLGDTVTVTSKLSVGGSMNVILKGGDNTFTLNPTAGGSGVNGNLSYSGNGGIDTVVLSDNSDVAGDTRVSLGNGANSFTDTATSVYAGDLSVTGGNDTNVVTVAGIVSGDFSNTLGNGDSNATTFLGSVGGRFRYRVGNGGTQGGTENILTLTPAAAQTIVIDAVFGTGASDFILNANVTLTGVVRGTGGDYEFDQDGGTLLATLFFINYPV